MVTVQCDVRRRDPPEAVPVQDFPRIFQARRGAKRFALSRLQTAGRGGTLRHGAVLVLAQFRGHLSQVQKANHYFVHYFLPFFVSSVGFGWF